MRRDDGFTIPEFLVGMVVLAIILAGFGQVLISSSKTSNRVEEQAMLQNDVRASIERFTTDLRSATNVHDDQPIVAATASTLTFDSPDGATPFHLRRISYRVNGTNLERSQLTSVNTGAWPWTWPVTTPVWTPEVSSLTSSSVFTYYDGDGAVTTDPTAVRSIRVTLSVMPKQTGAAPAGYSAVVTIRTLS